MAKDKEVSNNEVTALFDKRAETLQGNEAVLSSDNTKETARKNVYRDYITKSALLDILDLDSGQKVIDFGCGVGRISKLIAPKVDSVLAMDVSEKMLDQARKINSANSIQYVHFNEQFHWEQNEYDRVFTCWVLQHISDAALKKLISEFYDTLKSGGKMVLLEQVSEKELIQGNVLLQRSTEKYIDLFTSQGFKLLKHKKVMRFPSYGMHLWMKYSFLPNSTMRILKVIENMTIHRKPQEATYFSEIFVFEKP